MRRRLRELLKEVADIERLSAKLAQQTANARDLVRLRASLAALPQLARGIADLPPLSHLMPSDLCAEVATRIQQTIVDEPPLTITEGGLIRPGVDADLDELMVLSRDGRSLIAATEAREREATGISSLKVRYNKVFGYFIEVSKANVHRAPDRYIRKQTLSNAERYITPELKELEEKVLGADERRRSLEHALFTAIREELSGSVSRLQVVAAAIAELDVLTALAEVASDLRYVRPVVDEGTLLEIVAGRHPVVEQQDLGESFVPNDLSLGDSGRRLLIVTGPNMSGKSTVMRQAALIAILAQVGSFVPAESARVGICDRIFTRVGASDDLATGRSTFMVEMSETANILHHATERSLVVLDEIGRGTSTYDGLAIAWAVAEELHDRLRSRTMFATHYHQLTDLGERFAGVCNKTVAVREWDEEILFLHKIVEGGTDRSYGIHVARLAGVPAGVLDRARAILSDIEDDAEHLAPRIVSGASTADKAVAPTGQLSLFGAGPSAVERRLAELDPQTLTPLEALNEIQGLRDLLS